MCSSGNGREELIMSLINGDIALSEDTWTVSVVSNGIRNAFLVFERICWEEPSPDSSQPPTPTHTWYRADLRPSSLRKAFLIGTTPQIKFTTMTKEEHEELRSESCFRHGVIPGVTPELAQAVLSRIANGTVHGEKKMGYCVSGDMSSKSLEGEREFHNCISWCQEVIREELGYEVGDQRTLIKLPVVIVSGGVHKVHNV